MATSVVAWWQDSQVFFATGLCTYFIRLRVEWQPSVVHETLVTFLSSFEGVSSCPGRRHPQEKRSEQTKEKDLKASRPPPWVNNGEKTAPTSVSSNVKKSLCKPEATARRCSLWAGGPGIPAEGPIAGSRFIVNAPAGLRTPSSGGMVARRAGQSLRLRLPQGRRLSSLLPGTDRKTGRPAARTGPIPCEIIHEGGGLFPKGRAIPRPLQILYRGFCAPWSTDPLPPGHPRRKSV